jgi:hypothetical protein
VYSMKIHDDILRTSIDLSGEGGGREAAAKSYLSIMQCLWHLLVLQNCSENLIKIFFQSMVLLGYGTVLNSILVNNWITDIGTY